MTATLQGMSPNEVERAGRVLAMTCYLEAALDGTPAPDSIPVVEHRLARIVDATRAAALREEDE